MFEGNDQFDAFRDKLNAKGVYLRFLWEARSGVNRRRKGSPPRDITKAQWNNWPDVALVTFIVIGESERFGTGPCPVEKTAIGTAILVDYGLDGLGIWTETPTNSLDDDVARILGMAVALPNEEPPCGHIGCGAVCGEG